MVTDHCIPVIVGVGDVKNRSVQIEDAIEPMQLMLQATLDALKDTALEASAVKQLQASIDDLNIVATWTWPYLDLPGLLSEKLGIQPLLKSYSEHGGHQPMRLVDEASRRISLGQAKVAIVTGGESMASCESA